MELALKDFACSADDKIGVRFAICITSIEDWKIAKKLRRIEKNKKKFLFSFVFFSFSLIKDRKYLLDFSMPCLGKINNENVGMNKVFIIVIQ